MIEGRGLLVAEVAWPEVEQAFVAGAMAVLPVGAASKEHGYHLPLNTDFLQAEWLGREVVRRMPAVVWPTLSYGYYPVFVDYPGSITLTRATFVAVVKDILDGMARAGARTIALLNTGISTIEPLHEAIANPPAKVAAAVVNVYAGPRYIRVAEQLQEQAFGGHADELETSIMLALHGERVAMHRAEPAPVHIERGVFNRTDPGAPNYSPTGVNGNPTLATREKGERLIGAMLEDVLDQLSALRGAC